jgi:hypothetical protein
MNDQCISHEGNPFGGRRLCPSGLHQTGTIQHISGMKESGKVVAIDHNPKASIFKNADFGIGGEYEDIVPELILRPDSPSISSSSKDLLIIRKKAVLID